MQQQLELVQTDLKNAQAELEVMKQKYTEQNELRQRELEELSQMRADAAVCCVHEIESVHLCLCRKPSQS